LYLILCRLDVLLQIYPWIINRVSFCRRE
jgi:hypothetical protein